MKTTPLITSDKFDFALLDNVSVASAGKGRHYPKDKATGETVHYLDLICAFDIETSKAQFDGNRFSDYQSWMYLWCFQLGEIATVYGRTWMEFATFIVQLDNYISKRGTRILCFVHKLAYEFQFLSGVYPFTENDVFATDTNDPLWCRLMHIEMRCSYRLSGYSLRDWARIMETDHQKAELDHDVIRYPWTELDDETIRYCAIDVICVVECVTKLQRLYYDTLYSLPYTMIGYIRRRCKRAMRIWSMSALQSMQGDLQTYDRLRECFRGGDVYINEFYRGALLGDVYSYDISSSYPAVMCTEHFPMSKFKEESVTSIADIINLVERGRAVICKIGFEEIILKDTAYPVPYLPYSQCCKPGFTTPRKAVVSGSGRIQGAEYIEVACTDIDLQIIDEQYIYKHAIIYWCMSARYGELPQTLKETIKNLYIRKEDLRGIKKDHLEYVHTKQELNSIYGMMAQKVIYNPVLYKDNHWEIEPIDREAEYKKESEKAFLNFAWGCWVTAWGRYRLNELIKIAIQGGYNDFVYADTDSVKTRIPLNFAAFNDERETEAKRAGTLAVDREGEIHYIGTVNCDGVYQYFKTLRPKCYCRIENGELIITAAGIPKREASLNLQRDGGIDAFDTDFVFRDKIKNCSIWQEGGFTVDIDGHDLRISRNVVIIKMSVMLSSDRSYHDFVRGLEIIVDNAKHTDYNHTW